MERENKTKSKTTGLFTFRVGALLGTAVGTFVGCVVGTADG